MQVKPGRRRDELKFSRVDRKKHSDGVDLNTGLVRNHSFGHNGRAGGRRLTISDEYCNARYVGTLALNNNRPYSSTDCSRYSYFIFTSSAKNISQVMACFYAQLVKFSQTFRPSINFTGAKKSKFGPNFRR